MLNWSDSLALSTKMKFISLLKIWLKHLVLEMYAKNVCWAHISESTFSHVVAHVFGFILSKSTIIVLNIGTERPEQTV